MSNYRKYNSILIGIVCISLIILYLWFGYKILHLTNQMYPKLDKDTINPVYTPFVGEIVFFGSFVWTGIVIAMGVLWFKVTKLKYKKIDIMGTPEEKIKILTKIIREYENHLGIKYEQMGFGIHGYDDK